MDSLRCLCVSISIVLICFWGYFPATGEDDLQRVMNELDEITQVMLMGVALGLCMSSIEEIRMDYHSLEEQKTMAVYHMAQKEQYSLRLPVPPSNMESAC